MYSTEQKFNSALFTKPIPSTADPLVKNANYNNYHSALDMHQDTTNLQEFPEPVG